MATLTGDPRIQDVSARGPTRCRIPQRLPLGRQRAITVRPKPINNSELGNTRPRSANRAKEEIRAPHNAPTHPTQLVRHSRQDKEKSNPIHKVQRPNVPKRIFNDSQFIKQPGRAIITIPVGQKSVNTVSGLRNISGGLPDQESIQKREEREISPSEWSDMQPVSSDLNDGESITSQNDRAMQLKITWQDNIVEFERMKIELNDRQRLLLELYANLRLMHQKMAALGQQATLPPAEDLHIMNVANMTPDQLLQLCAGTHVISQQFSNKMNFNFDINKLFKLPSNLVSTCEETLHRRKEIIHWFEEIMSKQKIDKRTLSSKVNGFKAENDLLQTKLYSVKEEFFRDLNDTIECLRKSVNENTIVYQLRSEELTCKVSELNSLNEDLLKKIHNADYIRCSNNKTRIEELEKELKDEKCKKMVIKDRLSRVEGQMKINSERATQLEAALEQADSQAKNLERTVLLLREQKDKLQEEFDRDLKNLTESIKENSQHLEEIADAREKLQAEKEDLEKRLEELSAHYKESLACVKHEMNLHLGKLMETEKKYDDERAEKNKFQNEVERIQAQLEGSELRIKELTDKKTEAESQLSKAAELEKEFEVIKLELDKVNIELPECKNLLMKQTEIIKDLEYKLKKSIDLEENMKSNLNDKEEYIFELEKKIELLKEQLQEGESKIESYELELTSLKNHVSKLQDDFGEEMINRQRMQLRDATERNIVLDGELQKNRMELGRLLEKITEQEHILEQREGFIKMLSEKDEEQENIIKLLRKNLEMRTQADIELNEQMDEKNDEIKSLLTNVETRKKQISQLETIILALEEQSRKDKQQRKSDHETITSLEKKVTEYESYYMANIRNADAPVDNLDNLINMLEDELGSPFDTRMNRDIMQKQKLDSQNKKEKHKFESYDGNNTTVYRHQREAMPTKIVMGNYVKKTYIANDKQPKGDILDRKKAITSMDTQNWISSPLQDSRMNVFSPSPSIQDKIVPPRGIIPVLHHKDYSTKKYQFLLPNQYGEEKKSKMFKFAGHRL